jgi:SNF family Na+-dependent transporter
MIRTDSGGAGSMRPASVVWSSNLAVYLGTAGASVGLGSIWRFPYLAGTGGGSAFILIFVLACALVATPLLAAEFALGGIEPANKFRAPALLLLLLILVV